MFVMENDVESSFDIDVQQDEEENRRRETSLHGKVPGRIPSAIHNGHRRDYGTATGGAVSNLITGSGIDCDPSSNNSERSPEKPSGLWAGLSCIRLFCSGLCPCKQLFLPLCSMSIVIYSIVLPYWAWGEKDIVNVGFFKCCKAGRMDCSQLYDCVSSDSKFYSRSQSSSWLLMTYIVLNGISILRVFKDTDANQFCDGIVVFPAAMIGYSGIIVFLSGVIQSESFTRFPLRLSVHLAMLSLALHLSYAAVCFKKA